MDLGLAGRRALLTASSRGLGLGCATALAREGVDVTINGLDPANLETAAAQLREFGVAVTTVAADVNTVEGRQQLIEACPDPDILVNNNWGPPPGNWLTFEYEDWLAAVEANMLSPIMMIKAVVPGMQQRQFGRIVNITSQMVKSPFSVMGLSAGARAGLTAACKALSRDVAKDNVTINNMLPERIDTERSRYMARQRAESSGMTYEDARKEIVDSIAAGRMGTPDEFGRACAFLCAETSGYISGQNLQLDGGSYRGTF
jgi:3-oxoacyl-[acyl-carrier protein] reductase